MANDDRGSACVLRVSALQDGGRFLLDKSGTAVVKLLGTEPDVAIQKRCILTSMLITDGLALHHLDLALEEPGDNVIARLVSKNDKLVRMVGDLQESFRAQTLVLNNLRETMSTAKAVENEKRILKGDPANAAFQNMLKKM